MAQDQALTVVEAHVEVPLLPHHIVAGHLEGGALRLHHLRTPPSAALLTASSETGSGQLAASKAEMMAM